MTGPHPDPLELAAHLEHVAVHHLGTDSMDVVYASAAISLKRIADALSPESAHSAGQAFVDGLAGASVGHGQSSFETLGRQIARGMNAANDGIPIRVVE